MGPADCLSTGREYKYTEYGWATSCGAAPHSHAGEAGGRGCSGASEPYNCCLSGWCYMCDLSPPEAENCTAPATAAPTAPAGRDFAAPAARRLSEPAAGNIDGAAIGAIVGAGIAAAGLAVLCYLQRRRVQYLRL